MPVASGFLLLVAVVQGGAASSDSVPRGKLTALPVVSYSEVTGLQYGATAFYAFRVGTDTITRPSSLSGYASLTAKDHAKWYVQLDLWRNRNRERSRYRIEQISYPLPFYGFGADAPDDAEEWYSHNVTTLQWFAAMRIRSTPFFGHLGARFIKSTPREHEPGGLFETALVPGGGGSTNLAVELGLLFDSRDKVSAPRSGSWIRVIPSLVYDSPMSGVERLTIDARQYRTVGTNHVAAFQVQYDGIPQTSPFDLMPMIGSDTAMRGYPRGRFRDHHAFTAQGEFRSGYWRRIGAVAFAGGGTVARHFTDIPGGTWFPSVGAGLRYVLSPRERTVARLDLGIGRGTFGVSVGIGEAF